MGRSIIHRVVLIFLTAFLPIVLVFLTILYINEKADRKVLLKIEQYTVDLQSDTINRDIRQIFSDLSFLAHGIGIDSLWQGDAPPDKSKQLSYLSSIFLNMSKSYDLYDQIRLLNETGKEIIRINYNNGHPAIVRPEHLQSKKNRYYFKEAFKLNIDEIFVSPLDLNKEHGKIEYPLKPMIRFATPVADTHGRKRGIVLLNYFAAQLLNTLNDQAHVDQVSRTMLVNSAGYWLYDLNPENMFGFMYTDRRNRTIDNLYPDAWEKIKSENFCQFETPRGLFTARTVFPLRMGQTSGKTLHGFSSPAWLDKSMFNDYFWKIISFVPSRALYARRYRNSMYMAVVLLFLAGILFASAWKMAKSSSQREIDRNQLKNKNIKLRKATKAANSASKAKSEFLANMSHEIRTPMNGILGITRLVLDMELGEKQYQLLSNVMYSAENLLGILNDILDLSKIEAGQLFLEHHDFNLESMLDHLVSSMSFQAADKNIFLKNETDYSSLPENIIADELRLRQILVNLTGNAIKFTRKGGITIDVKPVKRSGKEITLCFSVKDTGIGLSPAQKKTIFDSFIQGDSSTARRFGGTGLGLSISRQLVEMMGGAIEVESRENQGSNFYFTVSVSCGKALQKTDPSVHGSHYENLKILLVEDNKINQDLARIVLEQDGQHVTVAENGIEALQMLCKQEFDGIFMDMQMPEMDGLTATMIIRRCEKGRTGSPEISSSLEKNLVVCLQGKHIPIIAMTANVLEKNRQQCSTAGMNDFLTKPFLPKHLYHILNQFKLS